VFIITVCQALQQANVRYAIVGGYAVALHGAVRGTVDVDIAIDLTKENLQRAQKALTSLGLVSHLPISAQELFENKDDYIKNRNLIAWNFYNPKKPTEQVDLIIACDLTNLQTKLIDIGHEQIHVLSKKDLIAMKKASGRAQDLEDVKTLQKL